jgi:predicted kinase
VKTETPDSGEARLDERPRVVVLVGLPASGKSSWARRHGVAVISTDELRWLLSDDATNQNIHRLVFAALRYLLRKRLELQRPLTFVDATNSTRHERRVYIKLGQLYDARVEAAFFDTPVETCKERNRERERFVPEWAIDAMAARLVPPTEEEGFESVSVIRPDSA